MEIDWKDWNATKEGMFYGSDGYLGRCIEYTNGQVTLTRYEMIQDYSEFWEGRINLNDGEYFSICSGNRLEEVCYMLIAYIENETGGGLDDIIEMLYNIATQGD